MKSTIRLSALLLVLTVSATAHATGGHPPKQPPPPNVKPSPVVTADSSAAAAARAGAVSGSTSRATSGDAAADADATGGQGIGTVEGDSSRFRTTAIALSVPGATAAPAVPGECLVHSRGWQVGMGIAARSGGTDLQEKCMDRQHCLAVADRYHAAGLLQAMADQLASCGGVSIKVVVPPPVANTNSVPTGTPVVVGVTPEQLAAEIRRLEQRQDAAFVRGIGK